MNAKLTAAAVVLSSLLGSAIAGAAPIHGAAPVYNAPVYAPPAPGYAAPAVNAPVYVAPVAVNPNDFHGWKAHAWVDYQRDAARRAQDENAKLARERADYMRRFGWDPRAMAAFDQRQAQERAFFNANELQHRNQVIQQLAMGVRPMPHDRDGRRA